MEEIQIKTTMGYHLLPVTISIIIPTPGGECGIWKAKRNYRRGMGVGWVLSKHIVPRYNSIKE